MKKIISSVIAIAFVTGLFAQLTQAQTVQANTQLLKSDFANHWAKNEIDWAINNKLMWKYSDGTFRPDETITQAQFLTSLVAVEGLKEKTAHPVTAGHWAKDAYEKAAKAGWFTPDIKVDPNARITRYEAAAWITNAWGHKTYDPMQFTHINLLITSSHNFNEGVYNTNKTQLAYSDSKYFKKNAFPTDKFTRSELAHTLKMIDIRKKNLAEGMVWIKQLQNSLHVKSGRVYGRIPKLPNIPYVKQASVVYWDGVESHSAQTLLSDRRFSLPAKGKLSIGATFNSSETFMYHWELPSLQLINTRELRFLTNKNWNNRNK